MKNYLLRYSTFVAAILCWHFSLAQNLVLNPSFEDYSPCPTFQNQVDNVLNWANFGGSPDYFNSCSSNPDFSVPNNWAGFQEASSGDAYCAFGTYVSGIYGCTNCREYLGGELSEPLEVGVKYYVSFKVNLSLEPGITSNCASNNIGVLFSEVPISIPTASPLPNMADVMSADTISDTLNWTTVFGSYISDAAYEYIVIGNFFDDNVTDTLIMDGDVVCHTTYYFIDDVCVSTDSSYAANYYVNLESELNKENIKIYPNPAHSSCHVVLPIVADYFEASFYNSLGEVVLEITDFNSREIILDLSELHSGIYVIEIKSLGDTLYYKLNKN